MANQFLQNLFLWEGLSHAEIEKCLIELQSPCTFEKGAIVYGEQDFPRAFAVVLSGKVSVCAHNGAMVRTLEKGGIFGVTALFGGNRYATTISVQSKAKLQFIEEELLQKWMEQYPIISMNYIRFLQQRILYLNDKIRLYTEDSAEDRLMGYIRAHTAPDGEVLFPGGLAETARELNIGRTSLYRTLDILAEKNIIKKVNQKWFREVSL